MTIDATLPASPAVIDVEVSWPPTPSMSSRIESRYGRKSTGSGRGDIPDIDKIPSMSADNNPTAPVVSLEPLPWTEADTDLLREQVAFLKNCLLEDDDNLPKEDIRDLLKTIYDFLRQERITRKDRILQQVSKKLEALKYLDLMKLVTHLEAQRKAGDVMEGQDVLLLTGTVGTGKTTTLHFLAGTEFEETEVDGFMHLEPVSIRDPRIEAYHTSCGPRATTKSLQTVPVSVHNDGRQDTVVICDAPGTGAASTAEEELAFFYGLGSAVERARRVKPVVVFSEELMGSCFAYLPDSLRLMKKELLLKSARDLKPLVYVFTHYEERHRTRLHQQFASLKSNGATSYHNSESDLFEEFVDDLISKTSPRANLVMPLEGNPQELLRELWNDSFVEDPKGLFSQTPPSESALKQLQLQLHITLEEIKTALSSEAYSIVLNRIVILDKLASSMKIVEKPQSWESLHQIVHSASAFSFLSFHLGFRSSILATAS